jgi:predicted PurR-regulated permease PerM
MSSTPFNLDRLVRTSFSLLVFVAILFGIHYLRDVLFPFAVAALFAFFLRPLVVFIQVRCRVRIRVLAIVLALVLVGAVSVGVGRISVYALTSEIQDISTLVQSIIQKPEIQAQAQEYISTDIWTTINDFLQQKDVQEFFSTEKFQETALTVAKKVLPGIANVFAGTLNLLSGLVGLTVVLLYIIFILLDYDSIMKGWRKLIPPQYRSTVTDFVDEFINAFGTYFRAKVLVALIVGILFGIGFSIIGLPLAIGLGAIIFLLNLVPYLQAVAFPPALLLGFLHALETGEPAWKMLSLVVLVFTVVQIIEDGFLTPRILGDATGLKPAIMLLALAVWGKILGLLGLIIALPVTYLCVLYYKRFLSQAEQKL